MYVLFKGKIMQVIPESSTKRMFRLILLLSIAGAHFVSAGRNKIFFSPNAKKKFEKKCKTVFHSLLHFVDTMPAMHTLKIKKKEAAG